MTYVTLEKKGYFGGKGGAGVFQTIINQIPPHRRFYSIFLGFCAVMRFKRPAEKNVGFDLDPEVVSIWKRAKIHASGLYEFHQRDAIEWLETEACHLSKSDFLYLDPPYLLETRSDSRPRYKCELGKIDHLRIYEAVLHLDCMVAISHYPCRLYDNLIDDGWEWRYIDFQAKKQQGVGTERLYMNYFQEDMPRLHDYSYLGDNYKQREHIKLKFERWKNNFNELPPLEQGMRLQYLKNQFADDQSNHF